MLVITSNEYTSVEVGNEPAVAILDHMGGFDLNNKSTTLDLVAKSSATNPLPVDTEYIFSNKVKEAYPTLDLKFNVDLWVRGNYVNDFHNFKQHKALNYKNFLCSFNGSAHVGRKLLVSILEKFGYFNTEYCSKNFSYSVDTLDGHLQDYVGSRDNFYRKFFISDNSEEFFQNTSGFGHVRFEHNANIQNLETKLTESFLHLVSETIATSYAPFVTEKFLYSVVTRGLFVAYAQPGWHAHLEKFFGFKKYDKLFDYSFDTIENPIERLLELITMISKFSKLTSAEWHDLYLIERDTVEYNYNHYFSKDYLRQLESTAC